MNNRIKDAFDRVQVDDTLKQNTLKYVLQKTQKKTFVSYKRIAVLATALFLLTVCLLSCVAYFTPISVISFDVNPSIELSINRFDRVIQSNAFNNDGERVLASANVRFMNYKDAIEMILKSDDMSEYISEDELVCITIVDDKDSKQQQLLCEIESCTKEYKNISYSSEKPEAVKDAHKEGMSYGKYKAFLDLKDCEPETTVDEVRDQSMKEIHDKIDAHKKHHGGKGEPPKDNREENSDTVRDESIPPDSTEDMSKPDENFSDHGNAGFVNGNGEEQKPPNQKPHDNQTTDKSEKPNPPENSPDDNFLPNKNEDSIMSKEPFDSQAPDMNGKGDPNAYPSRKDDCNSDCISTPDMNRFGPSDGAPPENVGNR